MDDRKVSVLGSRMPLSPDSVTICAFFWIDPSYSTMWSLTNSRVNG